MRTDHGGVTLVAPKHPDGGVGKGMAKRITNSKSGSSAAHVASEQELAGFTLGPQATLRELLTVIDRNALGIAFMVDHEATVLGVLTDGDARRALIKGASLDQDRVSQFAQTSFSWVPRSTGRAEVLDLLRARGISVLPVLDEKRRLVGVHSLRALLGGVVRPNWAVIMAGGQGVRLRPITESIPKPMIQVAGRPILERLVLHLTGQGIRRIFLSVNYLSHMIEEHFGDGTAFGCKIEYLRETIPLGTGGSLALLPEKPKHPLLVLNGDLVTQFSVGALMETHESSDYIATFGMRPYQIEIPFGVADVEDGRLVGLREKPTERLLINAGIYTISPRALRLIPKNKPFPITDLFVKAIAKGLPVGAHLIQDEWTDIGRHDELKRARGES